jgi:excisionase family DNA binding protein
MADEAIMTVLELAAMLRISQATVYRLVKKNEIPHFRVGFDLRFQRAKIEKWMEGK